MLRDKSLLALLLLAVSAAIVSPAEVVHAEQNQAVQVTPDEIKTKISGHQRFLLIDVRTQKQYEATAKRIKGALRVKVRNLKHRLRYEGRDTEIILYCASASTPCTEGPEILKEAGFRNVKVIKGGFDAWVQAGGEVEGKPSR